MFKKLAILLIISLAAVAAIFSYSISDNQARPVAGQEKTAKNGGVTIQYFINGPQSGETVLLLASFARSGSDFNELVEHLNRAGYRALIMQARGVDRTELPSMKATLFDYADDLVAVLNAEGLKQPVTVIGHAFGNRIARAFSSKYPQGVRSLVLLAAGDSGPPPEIRNAIFKILLHTLPESVRTKALHRAFFAPGNKAPAYWLGGWYPKAGLAQASATANTPAADWIQGGYADMLVVQPEFDAAAKEGADKLFQLYPDRVTIELLPNAGHAALPEQLEKVSELILGHLAGRKPLIVGS